MDLNFHLPLNEVDRINKPPLQYLQIQDGLRCFAGPLWTISYLLYVRQGYKDQSYGMPILALCANIGWELMYSIFYPIGVSEMISFIPWLLIDIGIVHTTIKFGPREWAQAPLVARNLELILGIGSALMVFMHWTFIEICGSHVNAGFWAGFGCQILIGYASIAQLISRNSTRGHSLAIWLCRSIGTLLTIIMFEWRYFHYPADYSRVGTPMAKFLFFATEVADVIYPFVYIRIVQQGRAKAT
ncbi:hypothetical protein EV356DRAFT_108224 [Viridothelium virens]|uniref:Integral membrane protein n=1 Tax=Viridothelium virens TaxID=1048519 RepID=A0A6A6HNN7_VIRVR|nr:hypothetical protein EV356DRAFT_108224 [Viridothelium virens]